MKRALLIGISEYQVFSPAEAAATTAAFTSIDQRQSTPQAPEAQVKTESPSVGLATSAEAKTTAPKESLWPRLGGPLNDVDNFESLFRDLGFKEIIILKNQEATKDAIITKLKKIVTSTTVAILYFIHK